MIPWELERSPADRQGLGATAANPEACREVREHPGPGSRAGDAVPEPCDGVVVPTLGEEGIADVSPELDLGATRLADRLAELVQCSPLLDGGALVRERLREPDGAGIPRLRTPW